MLKKIVALTAVLCLLAPVAMAMGPQVRTKAALRQAETKLARLEEQLQADPAALQEKMLARYDQMVKRAEELLANKAALPAKIVSDLVAAQARALQFATRQAEAAKNQEAATRRLANFREQQARTLARVTENAPRLASEKIARAEKVIANAAAMRERILSGEGLENTRENLEQRIERLTERIEKMREKKQNGK
ncbi:MAG: hypothetical protein DDT34_01524 [Firmicutes bacterium]|nr:hypothetical protein [Bacillota bacterium]